MECVTDATWIDHLAKEICHVDLPRGVPKENLQLKSIHCLCRYLFYDDKIIFVNLFSMSINKRAILSGALGATASFIAKLAFAPDSPVITAVHHICTENANVFVQLIKNDISSWFCPSISLVSRGVCLLSMVGLNAFMISTFLDGMDESGSVVGTALSTAANFCCSVSFVLIWKKYLRRCTKDSIVIVITHIHRNASFNNINFR